MALSVVTRPRASQDILEIAEYLGQSDPAIAERFLKDFEDRVNRLTEFPLTGSLCNFTHPDISELRIAALRRFKNYLVLYRPTDQELEIFRVVHGFRDLETLGVE